MWGEWTWTIEKIGFYCLFLHCNRQRKLLNYKQVSRAVACLQTSLIFTRKECELYQLLLLLTALYKHEFGAGKNCIKCDRHLCTWDGYKKSLWKTELTDVLLSAEFIQCYVTYVLRWRQVKSNESYKRKKKKKFPCNAWTFSQKDFLTRSQELPLGFAHVPW